MNIDEKKEWLDRYRRLVRKCENLNAQINIARQLELPGGLKLSDMPKGTTQKDLSDYAAKFDRLLTDLERAKNQRRRVFFEITEVVNRLDGTEAQILTYKYLDLLEWEDVFDRTGYSQSRCYELHRLALENLEIKNSVVNRSES